MKPDSLTLYNLLSRKTHIFCFLHIRVEGLSATHLHQKPMVKINFMKMKIMSLIIRIGSLFFIFLHFYSIYVQLLLEAVCSAFIGICCYPLLFPICNCLLSKFSGIGIPPHFYKKHGFNFTWRALAQNNFPEHSVPVWYFWCVWDVCTGMLW